MIKIKDAFKNGKTFIPFVTCGDPDLDTTKELIYALADAGAGVIELGIPFSDPTAEGETIQSANERALENGVTTDKIFDMLKDVKVDVPLVFMTYANVVFFYGIEKFAKKCVEIGVSGVILPDIPFEEKEEFSKICDAEGVDFISLIAPTSEERISMIAKESKGFVYCVSSLGVTGVRSNITVDVGGMVEKVRENTDTPTAIGFGISTPEQAKEMSKKADGVIVGSAIVKIIEKYGKGCVPYVLEYAKAIVNAIK